MENTSFWLLYNGCFIKRLSPFICFTEENCKLLFHQDDSRHHYGDITFDTIVFHLIGAATDEKIMKCDENGIRELIVSKRLKKFPFVSKSCQLGPPSTYLYHLYGIMVKAG